MDPFPEEWQLLSLFEAEPEVVDRDVPWAYNTLIFDATRGIDRVHCRIMPSYEILRLTWWQSNEMRLSLDLNWVSGLQVVTENGHECLIASFRDTHLLNLEFCLKPNVCLKWGTNTENP